MRKKRPGTYAVLATHYYDDPKIIEAGEEAELLYVRMLAYASGQPYTEGLIPDAVVRFRLGLDPNAPVTRGGTGKGTGKGTGNGTGNGTGTRIERLERSGLIVREGDSWRIVAWLKWNRSRADMERDKANDRRRKNAVTRGGTGKGTGNGTGNGTGSGTRFQYPDTDTDTDTDNPHFVRGVQGGGVADAAGSPPDTAAASASAPKTGNRGTRLPEGWTPARSQATLDVEAASGLTAAQLADQLNRFRDYWRSAAGAKGLKRDWDATWRNWVRRAADKPRSRQAETDAWYARAKARASNPNPLLSLLADNASPSDDPGRHALPPRSA